MSAPGDSASDAGQPSRRASPYSLLRRCIWTFLKYLSKAAGIVFFQCRAHHLGNVPPRQHVLLAPNHQSFLDPWVVGLSQPRMLCFLARDNLFRIPGFGWLISTLNAMPVSRGSSAPRQGVELSVGALRSGKCVVLFPEGTRSRDGRLQPIKRGIYLVARQGGAPVLPVYIDGGFDIWPRGRTVPRLGRVDVFFGTPIVLGEGHVAAVARQNGPPESSGNNGGDLLRLVEDGWAQVRSTRSSALSPQVGEVEPDPGAGRAVSTDPSPVPVGVEAWERPDGREQEQRKKLSAEFLATLGEAYRALEREARSFRFARRAVQGPPGWNPARWDVEASALADGVG